jgi:hypothetical protein
MTYTECEQFNPGDRVLAPTPTRGGDPIPATVRSIGRFQAVTVCYDRNHGVSAYPLTFHTDQLERI